MKLASVTFAVTLMGCAAFAGEVAPRDVAFNEDGGIDASLTGVAGDVEAGGAIMADKSKGNCIACHEVTALSDAPFHGNVGPMLDGAGERWTEAELRSLLVDAKVMFDGTVMPAFYRIDGYARPGDAYTGKAAQGDLDPLLTAQEIEDVVAFLMTLKEE
jgi:sulfur-oxidizing protein SoxX